MSGFMLLRVIYALTVCCGILSAFLLLRRFRRQYREVVEGQQNGAALFMAHFRVNNAWLLLYVQLALFAILVLGTFIPIHPWYPEERVYRGWITFFHVTMTLAVTWKCIMQYRSYKVLDHMLGIQSK